MKKYSYILLFLLICSCNYFENKKIHVNDELVQDKLKQVDKTAIDKFPVFKGCESLENNIEEEKECFIITLSNHISNDLLKYSLILEEELDESFEVLIKVGQDGNITINALDIPNSLKKKIPNIGAIVTKSILNLPKLRPGYKKLQSGEFVPITTQFIIPIKVRATVANNN